jgi:hypothetical protein
LTAFERDAVVAKEGDRWRGECGRAREREMEAKTKVREGKRELSMASTRVLSRSLEQQPQLSSPFQDDPSSQSTSPLSKDWSIQDFDIIKTIGLYLSQARLRTISIIL